jgi:leucyl-tRNA synthetase
MASYKPLEIESKWRARWEETSAHRARLDVEGGEPCYCLVMFSYPSGNKLHLGHWFNYGPTDSWARFRRMQGAHVFQPMGFDSFGLPAENYAIKVNVHPRVHTEENIRFMRGQLRIIGAMYDWDHELHTHDPDYYRWTQWLFLQFYDAGLAYRQKAPVNWCDSCQTVLANEQVIDGLCERCDHSVRRRELTQWFFRITEFADDLLEGLERIDWPEKTKAMQRNWIGRSKGASIHFHVAEDCVSDAAIDRELPVFTTRCDTVFGVTYMVLAPEHPLVSLIIADEQRAAVEAYVDQSSRVSEIERSSTVREKTGVFTGAYAINPVNGERIPIWVADYVLGGYGTGAVMAVPGHDERDHAFATKYGLPIRRVILDRSEDPSAPLPEAYVDDGPMCNSGDFDGLDGEVARERVVEYLRQWGHGNETINYRLRDWLISRQRYWGAPIPIVHCAKCGEQRVPDEELPILLPDDVEFKPTGESPLARHSSWKNATCPTCDGAAQRDTDTMDTFVDSSWYFLRYLSPHDDKRAFDPELAARWLPVHQYVGGGEHAVMHLLYARFFVKVLHRLELLDFDEPFQRLVHQGVITSAGARMSKSRGNVVNPESYLEEFGSDTLRAYLMFGFAYVEGGDWDDGGIASMFRYLQRVHRFVDEHLEALRKPGAEVARDAEFEKLSFVRHNSIKGATQDLQRFQFNTAISRHMELTNALYAYANSTSRAEAWPARLRETVLDWVRLLAPLAPHLGEELWEMLDGGGSVFDAGWPAWDEASLQLDHVTIVLQVNGKIREQMEVPRDIDTDVLTEAAKAYGKIPQWIEGKQIRKVIVVPEKLVNIVVSG